VPLLAKALLARVRADAPPHEQLEALLIAACEAGLAAETIFDFFDLDHDGEITAAEFGAALAALATAAGRPGVLSLSDAQLDALVARFDGDGSGTVSVAEFRRFCFAIRAPCWRGEVARLRAAGELDVRELPPDADDRADDSDDDHDDRARRARRASTGGGGGEAPKRRASRGSRDGGGGRRASSPGGGEKLGRLRSSRDVGRRASSPGTGEKLGRLRASSDVGEKLGRLHDSRGADSNADLRADSRPSRSSGGELVIDEAEETATTMTGTTQSASQILTLHH
jgi:hypothetical protein